MDLLEMMGRGGPLMWPILACSILGVYAVIDRFLVLRRARMDAGQFTLKLKSIYRHGDTKAVIAYCGQKDAPIVNIVRRGVLKYDKGDAKIREAIENAGRDEVFHLERRLSLLASIGAVAPMLGFLGTVTGLIAAFQSIESQSGIAPPASMTAGVWEALITTAFGLVVGIAAIMFYNYFVTRIQRLVHDMDVTSSELLDLLEQGPAGSAARVIEDAGIMPLPRPAVHHEQDFFRRKES